MDEKKNPATFNDVLRKEWSEIRLRRGVQRERGIRYQVDETDEAGAGMDGTNAAHPPKSLIGLGLSGGGIRSATFSLGVLQALNSRGLLPFIDYLSTVSGGGYVGGWWSAWLARQDTVVAPDAAAALDHEARAKTIFPPAEEIEPVRFEEVGGGAHRRADPLRHGSVEWTRTHEPVMEGSACAGRDPIHHLRLFANYLTPRKGALSADTWRAMTVVSRNLLLTWLILLPILVAVMLIGQLYFTLHTGAISAFPHPDGIVSEQLANGLNAYRHIHSTSPAPVLEMRLAAAAWVLAPIAGWMAVMIGMWLLTGRDGVSILHFDRKSCRFDVFAMGLGAVAVVVILWLTGSIYAVDRLFSPGDHTSLGPSWWWRTANGNAIWLIVAILLLAYASWPPHKATAEDRNDGVDSHNETSDRWKQQVRRSKAAGLNTKLLVAFSILTVVLGMAGFGHELVDYILSDPAPGKELANYITKGGGWLATIMALGGSIFTALKTSPTGGADSKSQDASKSSSFILTVTPPLVVLVLGMLAAWCAHAIVEYNTLDFLHARQSLPLLTIGGSIGLALALFYSVAELKFRRRAAAMSIVDADRHAGRKADDTQSNSLPTLPQWVLALLWLAAIGAGIWMLHPGELFMNIPPIVPIALCATVFAAALVRLGYYEDSKPTTAGRRFKPLLIVDSMRWIKSIVKKFSAGEALMRYARRYGTVSSHIKQIAGISQSISVLTLGGLILVVAVAATLLVAVSVASLRVGRGAGIEVRGAAKWLLTAGPQNWLVGIAVLGSIVALGILLLELIRGKGNNRRPLWMTFCAVIGLALLLALGFAYNGVSPLTGEQTGLIHAHVVVALILLVLAWEIAFGWSVDPNMISMHLFYKSRLVRAYMGASNSRRRREERQINDTVAGDDVSLERLRNCERGAPYHIINATLNLVGGRDLATAQRSAAAFVLTKHFCGSQRTRFRPTEQYMGGKVSLGTAVAISGAAVSPNMGSKTPTAALAMLMTLLNVRLGFWAPTPNREHWEIQQPRLWPFYILREFLSQTNELSSYCYLSDGGHFENNGLYALVERGCRYILLSDCGADPKSCFDDLGNAIRRCRIDFGTEITLDIESLRCESKRDAKMPHVVIGSILYSEAHARTLQWTEDISDENNRRGVVILLKPALTTFEPVDVRQYGFRNKIFPQQSTADQWFDEAQFESYRRLGELTMERAWEELQMQSSVKHPAGTDLSPSLLARILESASQSALARFSPWAATINSTN